MRNLLAALLLTGVSVSSWAAPAYAAPCKDAKGKFVACPKHAAPSKRCKLNGRFAKCGTPGARPV